MHHILQVAPLGVPVDRIIPPGLDRHPKFISTKGTHINDQPPIPTATSACRVAPITPALILYEIERNIGKETHIILVIEQIMRTIP